MTKKKFVKPVIVIICDNAPQGFEYLEKTFKIKEINTQRNTAESGLISYKLIINHDNNIKEMLGYYFTNYKLIGQIKPSERFIEELESRIRT